MIANELMKQKYGEIRSQRVQSSFEQVQNKGNIVIFVWLTGFKLSRIFNIVYLTTEKCLHSKCNQQNLFSPVNFIHHSVIAFINHRSIVTEKICRYFMVSKFLVSNQIKALVILVSLVYYPIHIPKTKILNRLIIISLGE